MPKYPDDTERHAILSNPEFVGFVRRILPSKHKAFVKHLYNVGSTSLTLVQHCIIVIQMLFCVCWVHESFVFPSLFLDACVTNFTICSFFEQYRQTYYMKLDNVSHRL